LVTARAAWGLDEDMPHLQRALDEIGVRWTEVAWDDEELDWSSFSAAVVRSTWDYYKRLDEFTEWIDRVGSVTRLLNPPAMLRWNADKHYLLDALAHGLPIVPTTFIEPHEVHWRSSVSRLLETGDVVVKPAVSAGSNDTERHHAVGSAEEHISSLLAHGRSVMLQPYLTEVEQFDETGLVYLGGEFSHAFAKGPLLASPKDVAGGLFARERIEPRTPSESERDVGDAAVAWLTDRFDVPLYARIDLLPTIDGPVVIELELTEPSLFLHTDPVAPGNAARAIAALSLH
jgi:glutathione synthase/RimK-type ligase-like ATP-grasp enzyme